MVCLYVSSFPVVCLCQCAVLSHKQFVALPVLAERFEVCRQHLQALAYATCLHGADCHTAHATDAKAWLLPFGLSGEMAPVGLNVI